MGDDPDFVQYVYDCALAGVPVERVRESYRGERVYIPGRPRSNSEKRSQIERDLRDKTALTPYQIAQKHAVGIATVYRIRSKMYEKDIKKPPRNL